MTNGVPQTIAKTLYEQMGLWLNQDEKPDALTLARLRRDAETLTQVHPADGSMIKAGIAVTLWDLEQAERWVSNALRFDSNVTSLLNAGVTYKAINQMETALQLALRALEKAPNDAAVIGRVINYALFSGRLDVAATQYKRAHDLGAKLDDDAFDPTAFLEILPVMGLTLDDVRFELSAACSVLSAHQKRARYIGASLETDPDGGIAMVFEVGFSGTLSQELSMEAELAQLLAERESWNPCVLAVELQYVKQDARQAA